MTGELKRHVDRARQFAADGQWGRAAAHWDMAARAAQTADDRLYCERKAAACDRLYDWENAPLP